MDDAIAISIHHELEGINEALWEIVKILERMEEREQKKSGEDPIARPAAEGPHFYTSNESLAKGNNEDTSN